MREIDSEITKKVSTSSKYNNSIAFTKFRAEENNRDVMLHDSLQRQSFKNILAHSLDELKSVYYSLYSNIARTTLNFNIFLNYCEINIQYVILLRCF